MKRFFWLGFLLSIYVICAGCGQTFRPIIIPNPPIFPNPLASHSVLSINYDQENTQNGGAPLLIPVTGSAMSIDVSGDTDVSVKNVGPAPVHAVQQSANQVLVVNQAVTLAGTGENLGTTNCSVPYPAPPLPTQFNFAVCPSITELTFSGTIIAADSTISLPAFSGSNFVAVAPAATTAYVTMPTYPPDPTIPQAIVPSVGVVSILSASLVATIPVGNNPYALAVTPDDTKLYVANQGDSTISGFNTLDRSQRVGSPVSTTSPPIWLVARSDNQRVYVLEQDGTLDSLDVTSTAGPDTLTPTSISVPGATTMTYDSNKNRLYIAGGAEMVIVDVSQSLPLPLATILIPPFSLLNVQQPVPAIATAVTVLPDGSRAYVGSYPSSAGAVLPSQFSVSSVSGDGTTGTYAYTLTSGHDLTPGVTVTVTGTNSAKVMGFDGTYVVSAIVTGTTACPGTCFQAANPTNTNGTATAVTGSGTGTNIFPQVTVVDAVSNSIKTTTGVAGFAPLPSPYDAFCASARFRFMMASAGDSTRAYLSSCDGGNVNIIDTSSDSYIGNLQAPVSSRTVPGSTFNPPQNPVFLLAGP